ncbi:MAG TPA: DUF4231 domain-containing protein [Ktedonobacteraceae bacterium]|nr:DUF4231 domain-containing protein [Ktedonobacteraceae bacterium]
MLRRITLFNRLPRLHPLPSKPQEIIPEEERRKHPAFAAEFAILQEKLIPAFRELENEALDCQNRYRFMYLILIAGSALTTILVVLELAILTATWLDIVGTFVALILTLAVGLLEAFEYQKRYYNARLGAERLRSAYFLFLGHLDRYENSDRVRQLESRIIEIRKGVEGYGSTAEGVS